MGIIQIKNDKTRATLIAENGRLALGELVFESDTRRFKIGNAAFDQYNSLPYADTLHVIAGITADVVQAQGEGPLTAQFNELSTVANAGDTVTLQLAVAGEMQIVLNNGANAASIFPEVGDDLGAGVNNKMSIDLAPGDMVIFYCYDATNWRGFVPGSMVT